MSAQCHKQTHAPQQKKFSGFVGFLSVRKLLIVISIILLVAGLVFVGQGSGYFPHPAEVS